MYAVQSALQQSFLNWEAWIVDDGSTDETRSVASGFKDARIHYLYQENRGLAAARNSGIRAAKSEIIALLDSDDVWDTGFLERMIDSINSHQAVAAYCGYRYIDAQGITIGEPRPKIVAPDKFKRAILDQGNWLIPSAVIFQKRAAQAVGLFDESLKALEDTDLWIRLSERGSFIGIDAILAGYRLHESSMSKDPDRMVSAFRQLTEKIHGMPDGDSTSWGPCKKIGYARYYHSGALTYLAQKDAKKSAEFYCQLFSLSKEVALSMRTWRALARIHMPKHERDKAMSLEDFRKAKRDLANLIDSVAMLAADKNIWPNDLRQIISHAFLAMAEEGVFSGFHMQAFLWLWRSALASPRILMFKPYWGTIARAIGVIRAAGA